MTPMVRKTLQRITIHQYQQIGSGSVSVCNVQSLTTTVMIDGLCVTDTNDNTNLEQVLTYQIRKNAEQHLL